jgi:predicted metal-dependent peptidase
MLAQFNEDLLEAMRLLNVESLDIVYCDTKVHVDTLTTDGRLNPVGGGGTDYAPVFAHADQEQYQKVIYLTDGRCDSFGDYSGDVLWVVYADNPQFQPPFGEIYHWRQPHV